MRRASVFILLLLSLACRVVPARGAAETQINEVVDYTFGGQVDFHLDFAEDSPVQAVQIFLRSQGDERTITGEMAVNGSEAVYVHNLVNQPLRAFSDIEYWFYIIPQTGEAYYTEPQTFIYIDNRYQWQTIEDELFRVHWYAGGAEFGQSVLDAAWAGLEPTWFRCVSCPKANGGSC